MSWMAFVEGFARTATDIIGERKEEAQEYKDRMREMAERNRSKITAMDKAVENNQMLIQQAKNLYATDEMITMALDADPVNGLSGMVQTLRGLQANPDIGANYTPEFVKNRYVVPDDIVANLDVMSRFGASDFAPGDTAAPQSNFLRSITARDAMTQAYSALDQEMLPGTQYSIFDASGITDDDLVKPKPGAFLQYVEPSFMSREMAQSEADDYRRMVAETTRTALAIRESATEDARERVLSDASFDEDDRDAAIAAANEAYNLTITQAKQTFINSRGRDRIGYAAQLSPYFANDPVAQEALRALGLTEEAVTQAAAEAPISAGPIDLGPVSEDDVSVKLTMSYVDTLTQQPAQAEVILKENGDIVVEDGTGQTASTIEQMIADGRVVLTTEDGVVYSGGGANSALSSRVSVDGYDGEFVIGADGRMIGVGEAANTIFNSQEAQRLIDSGSVSRSNLRVPELTGVQLADSAGDIMVLLEEIGYDVAGLQNGAKDATQPFNLFGNTQARPIAPLGVSPITLQDVVTNKIESILAKDPELQGLDSLIGHANDHPQEFIETYGQDAFNAIGRLTPELLMSALKPDVVGPIVETLEGTTPRGAEGFSQEKVRQNFKSDYATDMLAYLMLDNDINPNTNKQGSVLSGIDRDRLIDGIQRYEAQGYLSEGGLSELQASGQMPSIDEMIDILLESDLPRLYNVSDRDFPNVGQ